MNWLHHAMLVRREPLRRAGTLLADVRKQVEMAALPDAVCEGITHHHAVDRFTDAHPAVQRSVARIPAPYRRFAGVLVDVFYGRLLAETWAEHASGSLAGWLEEFHADMTDASVTLPPWPQGFLRRVVRDGWVADYAEPEGHLRVLGRLGRRLEARFQRPVPLLDAGALLARAHAGFAADFAEFQPALHAALGERR